MPKHGEFQAQAPTAGDIVVEPSRSTPEQVIDAFLEEGLEARAPRVRAWIARHPEFRKQLLGIAWELSIATLLGTTGSISPAELAEMRRKALESPSRLTREP